VEFFALVVICKMAYFVKMLEKHFLCRRTPGMLFCRAECYGAEVLGQLVF